MPDGAATPGIDAMTAVYDCLILEPATVLCAGLRFPEGPVALRDGSVLLVELEGGCITRVWPDGHTSHVAHTGGGPNGAAIGPDGALYVANSGGLSRVHAAGDDDQWPDPEPGACIQRVDLRTGEVTVVYRSCDGRPFSRPNDIAFDDEGGFYFTDTGRRHGTWREVGSLYYALADGSGIRRVAQPLETPNGVGLSPDGRRLYVAETGTARLIYFDVVEPGRFAPASVPVRRSDPHANYLTRAGGRRSRSFDSLAVDAEGNVCIATLEDPGITVVSPTGHQRFVSLPDDHLTTNLCFSLVDPTLAFVTRAETGTLVSVRWPVAGATLPFEAVLD